MRKTIDDPNHGAKQGLSGGRSMYSVRWAFMGGWSFRGRDVGFCPGWRGNWLAREAVILLVTPSIIGVMLLKRSGSREGLASRASWMGMSRSVDWPGVAGIVATILLIIPGFLTDMLGVILLVPALRRCGAHFAPSQRSKSRRTAPCASASCAPA